MDISMCCPHRLLPLSTRLKLISHRVLGFLVNSQVAFAVLLPARGFSRCSVEVITSNEVSSSWGDVRVEGLKLCDSDVDVAMQVHRQTAASVVQHMALGVAGLGCEDALTHLLNYVWPNIFETSPHVVNAVQGAVDGCRLALGPAIVLNYILQVLSGSDLLCLHVVLTPISWCSGHGNWRVLLCKLRCHAVYVAICPPQTSC